jgi:uncharacterized protein (TIGR03435 family)
MVSVATVIASLRRFALPLNRNRKPNRTWVIVSVILSLPAFLSAQESPQTASPDAPTFESAILKPSEPHARGHRFRVSGHRFETRNASLSDLISFAYGLHATQIIGAPDWVQSDKYDLTAQSDAEAQPSETLWRSMLQSYLVERFKLRFHRETQELPLYVLTTGRSGRKLTSTKADPNRLPELSITLGASNAANANLAAISATNATMADLAGVMQRVVLEWPVVDQTGIGGRYDFSFSWTPDGAQFGDVRAKIPVPIDIANPPPYLATALEEQMGLTLDVLYAPLQVLVIDHVEKPSENYAAGAGSKGMIPGRIWHPWRQPYGIRFPQA